LVGLLGIVAVSLHAAGPYLGKLDAVALLPAPPVVGSVEDKADRDSAFAIYSTRTDDDAARAKAEHEFDIFVFASAIGPDFTPAHYPKLAAVMAEAIKEVKAVTDAAKVHWNRPRPYVLEPERFSKHADSETSAAYPSGHSTRGTVMAIVLARLFPERRDAIFAKGQLIGWTRVEAGVHTPLDVYAGRVLGQTCAHALLRNPAFLADLAAAKAEARAAMAPLNLHP
jgi:acid phosphatase (class A)